MDITNMTYMMGIMTRTMKTQTTKGLAWRQWGNDNNEGNSIQFTWHGHANKRDGDCEKNYNGINMNDI